MGKVLSIDSASDAYEAGKLLYGESGACVLVENNGTVIGIITRRDFIDAILKWNTAPSEIRVRHIMSSPVHMIDSEATVEEARAFMFSKKIMSIPVLKEEKIIGIVLAQDLANVAGSNNNPESKIAETYKIPNI